MRIKYCFVLMAVVLTSNTMQGFAQEAQDQESSPKEPIASFDFEDGKLDQRPAGWFGLEREGFKARISEENPGNGKRCVKLWKLERSKTSPFGTINLPIDPKRCHGKRIRVRALIRAEIAVPDRVMMWFREDLESGKTGEFDNMGDRPIKSNEWAQYEIVAQISNEAKAITLGILLHGKGEAFIDDVVIEEVDDTIPTTTRKLGSLPVGRNKKTPAPGLFEINGSTQVRRGHVFNMRNGEPRESRLLLPLPLTHRSQYPLTYNLTADPPESLKSVTIYEDSPKNFVAEVILQDLAKHKTVDLKFNSVILVLPTSFDDVPKTAIVPREWPEIATPWLASTWCVESANERIKKIAADIRTETDDVLEIIEKVEVEAKSIYRSASGRVKHLTAVEALDKKGSCTSCANLIAALLRASDVPARILAGYPSWSGPLQTHYIVEAYVPNYGWYPIESTMCRSPWPNQNQINVSIVPPEYESEELAGRRLGVAGGVPYLTLTETPENKGHFFTVGSIPEKKFCDHECKFIRKFESNDQDWQTAAAWSKSRWNAWLNSEPAAKDGKLQFGPMTSKIESDSPLKLIDEIGEM